MSDKSRHDNSCIASVPNVNKPPLQCMCIRDVCVHAWWPVGGSAIEGRGSRVVPTCAVARQLLWWAGLNGSVYPTFSQYTPDDDKSILGEMLSCQTTSASQNQHTVTAHVTCSTEIRRNWAKVGTEKWPKYECI